MANLEKSTVGEANATWIATAHAHHGGKNEYRLMLKISMALNTDGG
jgi:hypothetical protein